MRCYTLYIAFNHARFKSYLLSFIANKFKLNMASSINYFSIR